MSVCRRQRHDPVEGVIDQMMENHPAYEPALEIIADKYHREIDA